MMYYRTGLGAGLGRADRGGEECSFGGAGEVFERAPGNARGQGAGGDLEGLWGAILVVGYEYRGI